MTRLLLLACFVLACQQRSAVQNPPPPPSPPPPPGGVDTIPIAGHALYVPAGFTVNPFAQQIPGPRNLALGPDGAVYVALQGAGQIARLVDADGDGVAESVVTVLTGLDQPFGLAFRGDTLYFAEQHAVKRLARGAGAPVAGVANVPRGGRHITPTLVVGPGTRMYLSVGGTCDVCDDTPSRLAAASRLQLH